MWSLCNMSLNTTPGACVKGASFLPANDPRLMFPSATEGASRGRLVERFGHNRVGDAKA